MSKLNPLIIGVGGGSVSGKTTVFLDMINALVKGTLQE